jgi:hypothetical protein
LAKSVRKCLAVLLLFALGGCGLGDTLSGASVPDVCPTPSILEDLQERVRFKPKAEQDLRNVEYHIRLNTYEGECDVGKKEITVTLALEMTALRGPALEKDQAPFAFWIWILDKDKKLLTRTRFPIIAKFEGRDTRIDFSEIFDVIIPQRKDHASPDWNIFIGLELSKEELAYNRRRLGTRRRN